LIAGIALILPLAAILQFAFSSWIKASLPNIQEYAFDIVLLWILPFWIALFNETILLNLPQIPSMTFTASMFRSLIVGIILLVFLVVLIALLVYLVYIHRQAGILIEKGISSSFLITILQANTTWLSFSLC
jgi:hypothetical protein